MLNVLNDFHFMNNLKFENIFTIKKKEKVSENFFPQLISFNEVRFVSR